MLKDYDISGVTVAFFACHYGHAPELSHINLRKEDREHIAGILSLGIPFEEALNKVRDGLPSSHVTRLHLLQRFDLRNIMRDFHLGDVLHKNDADSVRAWVEAAKQGGDEWNIVRYIKFQEEESSHGLHLNDFMLVIMTEVQRNLLQLFGPGKINCVDSTHGTNQYDFQLTTLLIVDDHGEGFPVAFCFSNRVDSLAMQVFFGHVKEAVGGCISEAILMTDDAEAFANAWTAIMGPPAHRLLCVWHVDRSWRKNLPKIQGDAELKALVYKTLRVLLETNEKENFHQLQENFLKQLQEDSSTRDFASYFEKHYATRPEMWAYCHRLGLHAHLNLHLEAFHRVLKNVFMQGKTIKRLDKSINALMRLLRAKTFDRILKIEKGKLTVHVTGIRKWLAASMCLSANLIKWQADFEWAVTGKTSQYVVQRSSFPSPTSLSSTMQRLQYLCPHIFMHLFRLFFEKHYLQAYSSSCTKCRWCSIRLCFKYHWKSRGTGKARSPHL